MSAADRHAPIAISMGDPTGIGPEIAIKAAADFDQPCLIVGDPTLLAQCAEQLELPLPPVQPIDNSDTPFVPGQPGAHSGAAAWQAIKQATTLVAGGQARALVTAPIAKSALQQAGCQWPGHTELLADLAGGCPVRMMLANHELRVVLVTVHEPLRTALASLNAAQIGETISIADGSLRLFGVDKPRIAVAGVNPHAGEGGLFGNEEIELIEPAIRTARSNGLDVHGPFAPDTIFMRARGFGEFDAVIAMYHDQGLIPIKYGGLDHGVNVTLGLPFVRTSPDHGTAFDIAGTGSANPASMLAALRLASLLSGPGSPHTD